MLYKNTYRIEPSRLKHWDYSIGGYYYVTICTLDKKCFFGAINNGKMILSDMGYIAQKNWQEIPRQFPTVQLNEFVIMPNHIHGIVINTGNNVCHDRDATNSGSMQTANETGGGITKTDNPMLKQCSLSTIIRLYKGRTKFEINKIKTQKCFAWQTRFYDTIIRTEKDLFCIKKYIVYNPLNWDSDDLTPM